MKLSDNILRVLFFFTLLTGCTSAGASSLYVSGDPALSYPERCKVVRDKYVQLQNGRTFSHDSLKALVQEAKDLTSEKRRQHQPENLVLAMHLAHLFGATDISLLAPHKKFFANCAQGIERELQRFRLRVGDTVKIRFLPVQGYLKVKDSSADQVVGSGGNVPAALFKLASPVQSAGEVLEPHKGFLLESCFKEHQGASCAHSRASILQAKKERGQIRFFVLNKGKNPELIQVKDALNNSLHEKELLKFHSSADQHVCWKGLIERVDRKKHEDIEKKHFSQIIKSVEQIKDVRAQMVWLQRLVSSIAHGVESTLSGEVIRLISNIMRGVDSFSLVVVRDMRQLISQCYAVSAFKNHRKQLQRWFSQLTKGHSGCALKYHNSVHLDLISDGKVHALATSSPVGGVTFVGGVSNRSYPNSRKEFSFSPVKKNASTILFGDDIHLVRGAGCDGERAGQRLTLVARKGGEKPRLAVLEDVPIDTPYDDVFTIVPLKEMYHFAQAADVPLFMGDRFVMRSKRTGKLLAPSSGNINGHTTSVGYSDQVGPLVWTAHALGEKGVEPAHGSDLITRKIKALDNAKDEEALFKQVHQLIGMDSFWNNRLHQEDLVERLILGVKSGSKNYFDSAQFVLQKMLKKTKQMGEYALIAQGEKDLEFMHRFALALRQDGMEQIQQLLTLVPLVHSISQDYVRQFLARLKKLRSDKKAEAQAAQMLLSHLFQEIGPDLNVTGTGNLLLS